MVKLLLLLALALPSQAYAVKFLTRSVDITTAKQLNLVTNVPTRVVIRYGLKPNIWLVTLFDNTFKTKHAITLDNLKFNTKYYYIMKVFDKEGKRFKSQTLSFTTDK